MPDKNRTTLSGITPEQLLRLKHLAFEMTGELSVSALIRLIADHGRIIPVESKLRPGSLYKKLIAFPIQESPDGD